MIGSNLLLDSLHKLIAAPTCETHDLVIGPQQMIVEYLARLSGPDRHSELGRIREAVHIVAEQRPAESDYWQTVEDIITQLEATL
jgi:hypothetical protein